MGRVSEHPYRVDVAEPAGAPEGAPAGRVLLLPGAGYTAQLPLLFWARRVALASGWRVATMRWELTDRVDTDPEGFVTDAAGLLDTRCPGPAGAPTVVIAKSLGTLAAPWAGERGYPGVWLTPLLHQPAVAAALAAAPRGLAIGGAADSAWVPAVAGGLAMRTVEIPGADHGLEVGEEWRASLRAQERVMGEIEAFLDEAAGR